MTYKNNKVLNIYNIQKRYIFPLPEIESNLINKNTLGNIKKIITLEKTMLVNNNNNIFNEYPSFFSFKSVVYINILKYPYLIDLKIKKKGRRKLRAYIKFINSGITNYKNECKYNNLEYINFLEIMDKIEKNIGFTILELNYYKIFLSPINKNDLKDLLLFSDETNEIVKLLLFRYIILSRGSPDLIKLINSLYNSLIKSYDVELDRVIFY